MECTHTHAVLFKDSLKKRIHKLNSTVNRNLTYFDIDFNAFKWKKMYAVKSE